MILNADEGFDLHFVEASRVGVPLYCLEIVRGVRLWYIYRKTSLFVKSKKLTGFKIENVIVEYVADQLHTSRKTIKGKNQAMILHRTLSRNHSRSLYHSRLVIQIREFCISDLYLVVWVYMLVFRIVKVVLVVFFMCIKLMLGNNLQ